jgi:hypothetical protein
MAFFTAKKRGKMCKKPAGSDKWADKNHTPSTMYSAVEFGHGRPDSSRRFTNNYGKTAGRRGEVDVETGENSRRTGRMFNWMKGESY